MAHVSISLSHLAVVETSMDSLTAEFTIHLQEPGRDEAQAPGQSLRGHSGGETERPQGQSQACLWTLLTFPKLPS